MQPDGLVARDGAIPDPLFLALMQEFAETKVMLAQGAYDKEMLQRRNFELEREVQELKSLCLSKGTSTEVSPSSSSSVVLNGLEKQILKEDRAM